MVFISPELADAQSSTPATDIKDFRTTQNINSSFAVMDSGYKYQFDRYNDVFRYVPLNGDVAGCLVRTDLKIFFFIAILISALVGINPVGERTKSMP